MVYIGQSARPGAVYFTEMCRESPGLVLSAACIPTFCELVALGMKRYVKESQGATWSLPIRPSLVRQRSVLQESGVGPIMFGIERLSWI